MKDRQSRHLYANKEFKKAFHVTEEIKGKTQGQDPRARPMMGYFQRNRPAFQAVDRQVLEAGLPTKFEDVALYEDGQHTRIVQKFPLFNAEGGIYAIGGVLTDITERKQQESARRYSEER